PLAVAAARLAARLTAAGGDKPAAVAGDRIAESVKGRHGGRADLRADIRARHRVDLVAKDPPSGQPFDIDAVERDEAGLGELRRGAQLAGAECGRRSAERGKMSLDGIEALRQRHGPAEACPLGAKPGL